MIGERKMRVWTTALALLACGWLAGCYQSGYGQRTAATGPEGVDRPYTISGYTAGSVHPREVKTVYVEMFKSQEFRREIEFRLTEAVIKRILTDTPYQIGTRQSADTILYGEIVSVPVTLMGVDADTGAPRELQQVLRVNWTWKNRRTGEILAQRRRMEQTSEHIPVAGETFFDGTEEGVNDLAERIVEAMEADW